RVAPTGGAAHRGAAHRRRPAGTRRSSHPVLPPAKGILMTASMRSRLTAAVAAIAAGGLLALLASAGPAVAFFSGGLFLDVQVGSPATLVARGAAVDVPVEVSCNAPSAFVTVSVTQRAGSGVAQGTGSTSTGCTGSGQQILVRVQATNGGKTFKQGTALANAEVSGCRSNVCGSETGRQGVSIQR